MVNRWLIALVVASLAAGGWLGWTLRGAPPKPDVVISHTDREESKSNETKTEATEMSTASVAVVGPTEVKRTVKRFHPPQPSCAPSDKPCVCPEGALAEVEHTTTTTGAGSVATNTTATTNTQQSKGAQHSRQQEAQQVETWPTPAPRFTLGLGVAGSPLADQRKVAPAVSLGVRVYEHYTLRVAADVPATAPKDARVSLLLELPL